MGLDSLWQPSLCHTICFLAMISLLLIICQRVEVEELSTSSYNTLYYFSLAERLSDRLTDWLISSKHNYSLPVEIDWMVGWLMNILIIFCIISVWSIWWLIGWLIDCEVLIVFSIISVWLTHWLIDWANEWLIEWVMSSNYNLYHYIITIFELLSHWPNEWLSECWKSSSYIRSHFSLIEG